MGGYVGRARERGGRRRAPCRAPCRASPRPRRSSRAHDRDRSDGYWFLPRPVTRAACPSVSIVWNPQVADAGSVVHRRHRPETVPPRRLMDRYWRALSLTARTTRLHRFLSKSERNWREGGISRSDAAPLLKRRQPRSRRWRSKRWSPPSSQFPVSSLASPICLLPRTLSMRTAIWHFPCVFHWGR